MAVTQSDRPLVEIFNKNEILTNTITIMDEKNVSFFRFEDLRIYAKSVDYSQWVLANMANPGTEAEKNLFESFCKSAFDIALNIAEGSTRNKSQFEHYLKISKTAIRECIVYTAIAKGMGTISEEQSETSREMLMELTRMIGALIISLQKGSRRSREDNDEADDNGSIDDVDTNFDTSFSL